VGVSDDTVLLVKIPEAARLLSVSSSMLRRMVSSGEIASVKLRPDTPHSAVRVLRDDVLRLVEGEPIESDL
jgi:excisionase family DNA binding protein